MATSKTTQSLLIVEDDTGLQNQLRWHFEQYNVIPALDRKTAIAEVRRHEPAVVLQDLGLPPDAEGVEEGFRSVEEILAIAPNTKIIVVTGNHDYHNALRAVAMGAYDFYEKPVNTETLDLIVQRAFQIHHLEEENRKLQMEKKTPLQGIIASDSGMLRICRMIEKVAPTSVTCMLLGESGTGKEIFSRAIHQLSQRPEGPFIAINCAAVPETLMESELFGYEKGAFTGAAKRTLGKVESANGGTLFLDEIGDMPLALQSKLLRFLQERVVDRVGGHKEIPVDVRVVCATNKNLEEMVKAGSFREDLFYRVSEMVIEIPPLRNRGEDKILLAKYLLRKYTSEYNRKISGFNTDATVAIEQYNWPGNIREMENKIKRAVIMCEGKLLTSQDLGLQDNTQTVPVNLRQIRHQAERDAITKALLITDGNNSEAAKLLGITRPTLYDLLNKYDLRPGPTD